MFGTSCRGVRPARGLHEHAVASLGPLLVARPAPELAGPREGGWCWQLAPRLLPSIRWGRFLLFLSQPWQQDRSPGFILMPHQCVPSSQNQTPAPSRVARSEGAQPGATTPRALCGFPWGELPPAAVFPAVPGARVVAPAAPRPRSPAPAARAPRGPKH